MSIKKILLVVILVSISVYETVQKEKESGVNNSVSSKNTTASVASSQPKVKVNRSDDNKNLKTAFKNKQSDVQIQGSGVVVKSLPDDLEGSRHQKFILKDNTGQTVLVAHNIDLAPKIETLREGDRIDYFGEYEWNDRGGVIHWTHDDPRGRHVSGWLKHHGKTYQ